MPTVLNVLGNLLYLIGALILIPAGLIIITSPSTLLLAGPVALLIPVVGAAVGGPCKLLKNKARK